MKNETVNIAQPMSVEDYIKFEETAEVRHEYDYGNLTPMPGTSDRHNDVCFFLRLLLYNLLKDKGFRIYHENVNLQVEAGGRYRYPDVFATRDPRDFDNRYIKAFPELIVEVVSPESRITDTVDKFLLYRQIPSVNYYLLVDTQTTHIELRSRLENDQWESAVFTRLSDEIPLPLLEVSLPVQSIYAE